MNYIEKVRNSIKLLDVEEKFDLFFSRPLGLLLAEGAAKLKMTPNAVSFASMLCGIASGLLLFFHTAFFHLVIAAALLVLAGLLDSADGQLARILGTSSRMGMILDGAVDNVVFVSVYAGASFRMIPDFGWTIILWAVVAGALHSIKSLVYDAYKLDYLFFFLEDPKCRIPATEEVSEKKKHEKGIGRILMILYHDYVKKQNGLGTRDASSRRAFSSIAFDREQREDFLVEYRKQFLPMLSWWAAVCGTNFHRTLMIFFILLGRFELYLYIQTATIVPFLIIHRIQKNRDRRFLDKFKPDYHYENGQKEL